MTGVDTNVLVRYIVEDDPKQSRAAADLIERAVDEGEPLFVSQIVLCELVWVLSYAYRFSRVEIIAILLQLRRVAQLTIEAPDEVRRAIDAYAAQRGDFADYVIAERAIANGCSTIATFDRVLHTDPRFTAP
jgi:predicted nucleic-acid-binding protein